MLSQPHVSTKRWINNICQINKSPDLGDFLFAIFVFVVYILGPYIINLIIDFYYGIIGWIVKHKDLYHGFNSNGY